MKTFLLLVLLGVILYLGYRRAEHFGWPWQDQVVIASADFSMRGRNSRHVYVNGALTNHTTAQGTALVECKVLPGGMTLSPKATATVELPPRSTVEFTTSTRTPTRATGIDCQIAHWETGQSLEDRSIGRIKTFFQRFL